MLSVAIHKDIGEYEPKYFAKMSKRTIICVACALGSSVLTAMYITLVLGLQMSDFQLIIYGISVPFWLCGFLKPSGMKFEVYARYWLEYNYETKHIHFIPSFSLAGFDERSDHKKERNVYGKELKKLANTPGIEAYSPKAGRVV